MDPNVPLVVPEVNPNDIFLNKGIIANPNCSTIQAVVPLKVLDDKYKIKRIIYSTYQAVSGAGKLGLEDLLTKSTDKNLKKFPHPIYNNCLPHIDVFLNDGYTKEEHKMINETRKILGNPNLNITATAVRVPVENSHSESINVEFEKDFDLKDLINVVKKFSWDLLLKMIYKKNNILLLLNANGNNEVFVGRIRRDFSVQKKLIEYWVVADNLRKGAATNAVQILENLLTK